MEDAGVGLAFHYFMRLQLSSWFFSECKAAVPATRITGIPKQNTIIIIIKTPCLGCTENVPLEGCGGGGGARAFNESFYFFFF